MTERLQWIFIQYMQQYSKLIGILCPSSPQEFLQAEIAFISDKSIQ